MIPAIGLMIAAYIATRMIQILSRPKQDEPIFVRLYAAVTIIVAALSTFDLLFSAASVSPLQSTLMFGSSSVSPAALETDPAKGYRQCG